jgi:hypothetical protein
VNGDLTERKESLWALVAAPAIWAVHFLAAYAIGSVHCAKLPTASFATARAAIIVMTAIALVGVVVVGWGGWKRHRLGAAGEPHDQDTPLDRHRFLGFATALLAGLSAIAISFEALAVFLVGTCQ